MLGLLMFQELEVASMNYRRPLVAEEGFLADNKEEAWLFIQLQEVNHKNILNELGSRFFLRACRKKSRPVNTLVAQL